MDKILSKSLSLSLSGEQIMTLSNNKAKVIRYRDLSTFLSLDELLEPYFKVFVLIESTKNRGHWILLQKLNLRSNIVELYDSYGEYPDDQLKKINKQFREESNQVKQYLTHLVYNQKKYSIHFNEFQFQMYKKGINTCGRWCLSRSENNDMLIKEYNDKIKEIQQKTKLSKDEIICILVKI